MIPKIRHVIWLDEPMPAKFRKFLERFETMHPDWETMVWDSSALLGWMRLRPIFDQCATWAGKSDVLRYEVLAKFGGVYADTDVEALRPWDDLLDGEPFAGWEDANMICPTVMGSEPGHLAVEALIDALPRWFIPRRNAPPNQSTGPYFLTKMWRGRTDVRLMPPEAFYPVHWSRKRDLGGPYPAASYGVHHWSAGWLPGGPPQR